MSNQVESYASATPICCFSPRLLQSASSAEGDLPKAAQKNSRGFEHMLHDRRHTVVARLRESPEKIIMVPPARSSKTTDMGFYICSLGQLQFVPRT